MKLTRAAWIDVDLDAIVHNCKEMSGLANRDAGRNVIAMPIIKGGGYGHGIYEAAECLFENGFSWFGVATYSEALIAKIAAPGANVLILGYSPPDIAEEIVTNGLTQTVYALEQAECLSQAAQKLGKTAVIHIKVDTGMNRLGFKDDDTGAETVRRIMQLPGIYAEGIFTHFATSAMKEKDYVYHQFDRYRNFLEKLGGRGVKIHISHISNTGIILDSPELNQDMVRFGSTVFGTFTSHDIHTERVSLRDAFALRAQVVNLKELEAGEGVGYDLAFVTKRKSLIATLPVGYADIGIRRLRGKGYALIHGKRAPIVGLICMDQMMIDITDVDEVRIGDIATIIGADGADRITIKEVADLLDTDGYELLSSANHRLPVRYFKGGALWRTTDINQVLAGYHSRTDV